MDVLTGLIGVVALVTGIYLAYVLMKGDDRDAR